MKYIIKVRKVDSLSTNFHSEYSSYGEALVMKSQLSRNKDYRFVYLIKGKNI